jgi:SAM-dependent methyltransferase
MDFGKDYQTIGFLEPVSLRKARLDVHWEPSPREVVNEMIRMAEVRGTDAVYDLGCGDGRIVIAAAKQTGARGVGVDLDPQRIKESNENALPAEVAGLTRFLAADLFETDIGEATVLFLFLFPDVNRRLRPKLLAELRPGTRIVSYCHDMEQWEPDHRIRVRTNNIYLWVIPANMSGRWEGGLEAKDQHMPMRIEIRQEFQHVWGTVSFGASVLRIRNALVDGETFSFSDQDNLWSYSAGITMDGIVKADTIAGTIRYESRGETWKFTARRDPSTWISLAR